MQFFPRARSNTRVIEEARTRRIVTRVYAQDFDRDSNTIEVFVRRLRLKLGSDSIETVRGQGYRMARK